MRTRIAQRWAFISLILAGGVTFAQTGRPPTPTPPPPPIVMSGIQVVPLDQHDLPEQAKAEIRSRIERQKQGKVVMSSEAEVPDLDATVQKNARKLVSIDKLQQEVGLHGRPSDVTRSQLGKYALIGASQAGTRISSGWTGLTRVFNAPQVGHIVLEEIDLGASGGGATIIQELINERVGDYPAILLSQKASNHRSLTTLTWFSTTKRYRLRAKGLDDATRNALLQIARGISD